MALQEFWLGSVGPLYYDDTDTYPSSATTLAAFRGPQMILDEAPVADGQIVRLTDLATFNRRIALVVSSSTFNLTNAIQAAILDRGAGVALTLPASMGLGEFYYIKNVNGTSTVSRAGSDTIDGGTSPLTLLQWEHVMLIDYFPGKWAIL